MNKKISIYDSTLRDGAQAEGISFSVGDKIRIVEALDELGVDYIEAGNPSSNIKDLEFFSRAKDLKFKNATLVAFGSTRKCNIKACEDSNLKSLISADTSTVAIFGKSWDFHVKEVLKTSLDENLNMIADTIKYLVQNGKKVFYDAEHFFDGYKRNPEYALETIKVAEKAGASAIVLCDTNGGIFPNEVLEIVKIVRENIKIEVGIHTHNDTGQAIANSVMAVFSGATQVQGTFIGFGERTGNANLSTIIGNLEAKSGFICLPKGNISMLTSTALLISEISNISLDDNMPYVGKSAFAHKAGMHIDAVLKNSESFEHIDPSIVGNSRRFLLSEVAGRGTILRKIKKINPNIEKDDPIVARVVEKVKELEYKGYQFEGADGSFNLLALKEMGLYHPFFKLEDVKIIGGLPDAVNRISASAVIKVRVGDKTEITAAEGEGPVNAMDLALRKALEVFYPVLKSVYLTDFKVRVLDTNAGTGARVRVLMESTDGVNIWSTVGVSTDVTDASWKALVDSLEYKLNKETQGEK